MNIYIYLHACIHTYIERERGSEVETGVAGSEQTIRIKRRGPEPLRWIAEQEEACGSPKLRELALAWKGV